MEAVGVAKAREEVTGASTGEKELLLVALRPPCPQHVACWGSPCKSSSSSDRSSKRHRDWETNIPSTPLLSALPRTQHTCPIYPPHLKHSSLCYLTLPPLTLLPFSQHQTHSAHTIEVEGSTKAADHLHIGEEDR